MIGNRVYLDPKKLLDIAGSDKLNLDAIKSEIHSYIKNPKMSIGFPLEDSDLKDLLLKGFEGKDIFKAYVLGNELLVDPKRILEVKKDENKDLNTIENEIKAQKTKNNLSSLASRYPEEFEYLSNENMSDSDIITLLTLYNQFDIPSIQVLLEDYRNNNFSLEYLYNKYKNNARKVSQEYIDKYGLTEEDIEGVNDDIIKQIEKIVEMKPEMTVKQLLQQMQEAKKRK